MAIFNLSRYPDQLIAGVGSAGGLVASTTTTNALSMQDALQEQYKKQCKPVYYSVNQSDPLSFVPNDYFNNPQEILLLIEEGE